MGCGKTMINIIYEDNHLLVVEKPINMPSQQDNTFDKDLLSYCKQYLKEKYNKPGDVYLALLHRLDRPVGGIMVFAKTSKAAARMSTQIQQHKMHKKYYAVLTSKPKDSDTLVDYLVKNMKTNMVKTTSADQGKKSILHYQLIDTKEKLSLVSIDLETGRSHQIRVQFSSRNLPLFGDQRYNHNAKIGQQIALFAYQLSFEHPISKEVMTFSITPKNYPFNLFDIKQD
ncbi:MAG: RluA family pseudouridine synthase [Erysipelotrichaceae bacterium]